MIETATHTTIHMDTDADRSNSVGWIRRVEIDLGDEVDVQTDPITVAEAIEISGDRDRIIAETDETIEALRAQEREQAAEIEADFDGEELADERRGLAAWIEATDRLAEELAAVR